MRSAIRLLYVDDDPNLLDIGKFFLETDGQFSVDIATSASAGLTTLKSANYDAIISDYQMPDMDGIQFLVEVRKRFGSIPFILFTGRGREEVVIQALNEGADFYLQKGGDVEAQFAELSHKINRAISGRQAEDALLESERRMREIIDNAPFGAHLYELKPDGRLVFIGANRAADNILNVKNQQFIGKTIEEAFPPLSQTDIPDAYRRVAATGEQYDRDHVDYADDGGIHGAFEVHASHTGPNRMATFFRDITERKRAEEEITFKNIILSTQEEISPDGILIVDENAKILNFNRRFTEIWRIPDDLIASRIDEPVLQFVTGQLADPEVFLARVRYLYDHKDEKSFEELCLKDGRVLERFSAPMLGAQGKYYGRVWYFRDITERKRVEDTLRIKDTVFESSIAANSIGNNQGIITSVNPAFLHIWGYRTKEDAIGKSIASFFAHEKDAAPLLEALDTFGRWEGEFTALRGDGSTFIAFGIATVIRDETGKQIGYQSTLLDITERKRAEEALKESESRYRTIFESTFEFMALLQPDGSIQEVNETALQFGGFSLSDMIHKPFWDARWWRLSSEIQARLKDAITRVAAGGFVRYEVDVLGKNDQVITIDFSLKPVRDASDTIISLVAEGRDITERKRAEESLRESESRYRLIAENTADVIWTLSYKTGKFTYVSPSVQKLRGYTPDEVLNQTMAEALTTDSMEAVARLIQEGISERKSGDTSRHITTNLVDQPCKDGSVVSTEVVSTIVFDEQGHPVEIIGISRNITERKRAEEALRESHDRFEATIASLDDAVFLVDPATRLIIECNDATTRIFGYSREELVGRETGFLHVDHAHLEQFGREARATYEDPGYYTREFQMRRKDGSVFPTEHFVRPIHDTDGRVLYVVSVVRDITERKRAEELLKESEQRYRNLYEYSRDAIMTLEPPSWRFTSGNPATVQMFMARDEAEFILKEPWVLSPEHQPDGCDSVEKAKEMIETAIRDGIHFFEWTHRRLNGEDFHATVLLSRVELGGNVFLQATVRDVTERKRGEDALRIKDTVFESSIAANSIADNQGIISSVNPAFLLIWGYQKKEDAIGKCIASFFAHEKDAAPVLEALDTFGRWEGEFTALRVDGSTFIAFGIATVIRDETGKQIGYQSTLLDITKRKRVEEALQHRSATLSILNGIISTANKADNLPQLLNSILEESLHLLDFDGGGIYLVDRSTRTAHIAHSKNLPEEFLAEIQTLPIDKKPYDTLFIKNEPIITENYAQFAPDRSKKYGFLSLASIPLLSKGVAIGALNVTSKRRQVISEEEKQTLISISRELGSTIERMAAEEEVRKTVKNLETLFNSVDEMVFVLDMQGNILAVNEAVLKRLSYTQRELIGTNVLLLHVPERRDEALRIVQGMIAGTIDSCPVPVLAKDGTRIEVETKVTRGWWNGNEVLIGVTRDITERKRAEEALKESEERYKALVETAPDMIWQIDPDGTFRYISPQIRSIMGYEPGMLIGRNVAELIPESGRPYVVGEIARHAMLKKPFFTVEVPALHKDGRDMVINIRSSPIFDRNGDLIGLRGIARDITERKQAEEALREANKKLNLLSSITRHDINNQLTVLKGYLTILKKKQPDLSFNEYFEKTALSAQRISSMIQFTKEYEKIGVNAPAWQDCRTLINTAAKQVPLGQVIVKNDFPAGAEVFADPLIVKVFYNLLDNVIRYGGKITTIRFSVEERERDNLIVCEDDGEGIPVEEKEMIFERGFGKNTGMGLFLAREILSITHITIAETGEPGRGARFEMTVPKGMWRIKCKKE